MTCTYGASVKPGIDPDTVVTVDRSVWETVTGSTSSWLDSLLAIFVPSTIKVSDLCALNLVDPTLPSVATIASALRLDPISISEVVEYIRQKLLYSSFTFGCVCNPNPTPTCQYSPTTSGGTSPYTTGSRCYAWGFAPIAAGASCTGLRLANGSTLWSGPLHFYLWDSSGPTLLKSEVITVPVTSGHYDALFATPQALTAGHSYVIAVDLSAGTAWEYYPMANVSANSLYTPLFGGVNNPGVFGTYPNDTGEPWWNSAPIVCAVGASSTPTAPVVDVQPPLLTLPPTWSCGTDGDICTRLQQVSEKIDWLIRTQPSPVGVFSLSESTVHTGLTGTGTLAVAGILGLKVSLTTIPSYGGSRPGSPTSRYDIGRVDLETPEGWYRREWIHETPQLLEAVDPLTTTVGYSLQPGVVATITELRRGP